MQVFIFKFYLSSCHIIEDYSIGMYHAADLDGTDVMFVNWLILHVVMNVLIDVIFLQQNC